MERQGTEDLLPCIILRYSTYHICFFLSFQLSHNTSHILQITEENVSWLTIMTNGGSGDVDIYYKLNDYPT